MKIKKALLITVCARHTIALHYTLYAGKIPSERQMKWKMCERREESIFFLSRSLRSVTTHTHTGECDSFHLVLFFFYLTFLKRLAARCSLNLVYANDNRMCDSVQCVGPIRIHRTKRTIKYVQIIFCVCYAFSSSSVDRKLQITASMIIFHHASAVKQLCLCARMCSKVFCGYLFV